MSAILASAVSREAFEKALTIATEGKGVHGLYAVEDAQAMLEPIAKFHWRQTGFNLIAVLVSFELWLALDLPWYAPVVGIVVGALITHAITRAPLAGKIFAPPGYTANDVSRASSALFRSTIQ